MVVKQASIAAVLTALLAPLVTMVSKTDKSKALIVVGQIVCLVVVNVPLSWWTSTISMLLTVSGMTVALIAREALPMLNTQ